MAGGKRLRCDLHLRLRYRLPEGRSENRLGLGRKVSLIIFFALDKECCLAGPSIDGSVTLIVLSADLTTLLRAFLSEALLFLCQREMLLVNTLSMVPL